MNRQWSLKSTDQRPPVIRVLREFHPVTGPLPSDPPLTPHLVQQSGERWPDYGVRLQDSKNELGLFLGYRYRHRIGVVVHKAKYR
jgi:hypothetical protein